MFFFKHLMKGHLLTRKRFIGLLKFKKLYNNQKFCPLAPASPCSRRRGSSRQTPWAAGQHTVRWAPEHRENLILDSSLAQFQWALTPISPSEAPGGAAPHPGWRWWWAGLEGRLEREGREDWTEVEGGLPDTFLFCSFLEWILIKSSWIFSYRERQTELSLIYMLHAAALPDKRL